MSKNNQKNIHWVPVAFEIFWKSGNLSGAYYVSIIAMDKGHLS